jgi:hypothetical protein
MTSSETLEALVKFCGEPWEFQQTFETPLKHLQSFVTTIISAGLRIKTASITIDQAVFEPHALIEMLNRYSIPAKYDRGLCLTATGEQEVHELLATVLSDWIDFLFVPEPQSFAIYADHDEFATFYAHTRTDLERVTEALSGHGFKAEPDYVRRF